MKSFPAFRRPLAALLLLSASGTASTTAFARSDVCRPAGKAEIARLFDEWNAALRTGEPDKVVALYAPASMLLPTVSNTPRFTPDQKRDYFVHFMQRKPRGRIDSSWIEIGCNEAIDAGLYTFTFDDGTVVKARYSYTYAWRKAAGRWLITSHHSSKLPE